MSAPRHDNVHVHAAPAGPATPAPGPNAWKVVPAGPLVVRAEWWTAVLLQVACQRLLAPAPPSN